MDSEMRARFRKEDEISSDESTALFREYHGERDSELFVGRLYALNNKGEVMRKSDPEAANISIKHGGSKTATLHKNTVVLYHGRRDWETWQKGFGRSSK